MWKKVHEHQSDVRREEFRNVSVKGGSMKGTALKSSGNWVHGIEKCSGTSG